MKHTLSTALAAAAASTLFSSPALGAGTALDVQSGRATGMASAVTADVDDASAVYFNPAGIAQGRAFDVQIGDTLILPSIKYTNPQGGSTTTPFSVVPPFQAYASGGVTDSLSIGVGVFTPYGLTLGWPAGWQGRSVLTQATLATYYINPTVAYRLGPIRIGAGVQLVRGTVDMQRDIALPGGAYGSTELGGDAWGVGGNVGVQVDAVPKVLSFGAHYRSAVALDFDGNAHFSGIPPTLAGTLHDQSASTRLVDPDTFAFGVGLHPVEHLLLEADVVYWGWNHLHSVDIHFPNDASGTLSSSEPKNWSSTLNYHLGAEYALDETWRIRAGALLDPTGSPSNTLLPDIPDVTRLNLALGGGWRHRSGLYADLGYQFVYFFSKNSTAPQLPGDYAGFVNVVGLSVGYTTRTATPGSSR